MDQTSESSPHARGSSRLDAVAAAPRRVVPARAGIFRSLTPRKDHRHRRPRTRGDLPRGARPADVDRPSSPHARGSSHDGPSDGEPGSVVPARAGIFRATACPPRACRRRPRTRGDLPFGLGDITELLESSPHARGSSAQQPVRPGPVGVVPARAGIFLQAPAINAPETSRPRTRGDLPRRSDHCPAGDLSSPHARGSSDRAHHAGMRRDVVPARAGIFHADRR